MTPRIPPLPLDEADASLRELLQANTIDGRVLNIFATLAHHPDLLRRWLVFGTHVLRKSTLSPRHRELVILRIGWLCGSEYEWGQHVLIGKRSGLSDEDVVAIADGAASPSWSEVDSLLLQATDELYRDAKIQDPTWSSLSVHLDRRQLMDLVFAVGQYNLVSMALRTFGVERDDGVPGFEETAGRAHPGRGSALPR